MSAATSTSAAGARPAAASRSEVGSGSCSVRGVVSCLPVRSPSPTRSCSPSTTPAGRTYVWQGSPSTTGRNPCGAPEVVPGPRQQPQDRAAGDDRRHRARHDDRVRPGPAPVPRPGRDQPADLPADGDARGRAGRLAAGPVPQPADQPGFNTIVIAHVMFCISFVVVTVKARLASLDPRLEQAAMDLYADEWQTFRRITLPLVAPGILAAALLAFSLSFDDFIITNFNSGTVTRSRSSSTSRPRAASRRRRTSSATAMFVVALLVVLIGQLLTAAGGPDRVARRAGAPAPSARGGGLGAGPVSGGDRLRVSGRCLGPGEEQRALALVAVSAAARSNSAAASRPGRAGPAGRRGPPAAADSRRSAGSTRSASTIGQPGGRPVGHADRDRPVELDHRRRRDVRQHLVQRGDPRPVGLLGGRRPGRGRRRSRPAARTGRVAAERLGPLQRGQAAADQQPVPAPPVLVRQQHRLAVRAGPGRQPGGLELHQRDAGRAPPARPAAGRPASGPAAAPRRTAPGGSSRRRRWPSTPR